MAKKDRSFAAKVAKSAIADQFKKHCPTCGDALSFVKLVTSEKSEIGSWKFKEKFVGVCKCNQKEVYA